MKKTLIVFKLLCVFTMLNAQSPHSFKYQAVVRDANGAAISNSSIGVMINIYMDSCNGNNVYRETFVVTSNDYGLINLNVGEGQVISPTPIGALYWSSGSFFLKHLLI